MSEFKVAPDHGALEKVGDEQGKLFTEVLISRLNAGWDITAAVADAGAALDAYNERFLFAVPDGSDGAGLTAP